MFPVRKTQPLLRTMKMILDITPRGLSTKMITGFTPPKKYQQPSLKLTVVDLSFPKFLTTLPDFSGIDYDQFVEILKNKKAIVIDVRNPDELQDYGAIPGTINIPLKNLKVIAKSYLTSCPRIIHTLLIGRVD